MSDEPPNKGMKQTSVEHIGRSQLIPGVRRTWGTRPGLSSGTPMRPILLPCFSRPLPVTERFVSEVGFFAP